ncbi:translation initiation factor eIF3 subunit g [Coemansia sp. Benny D115]|nr:translation initiation factor eIF3 subunit g [Coemansia sp. Benny D115]
MADPLNKTTNWADDDELEEQQQLLPEREIVQNDDGTKTVMEYRFNDDGKIVRMTRRIQERVVQERVNAAVAERKKWAKFGAEKGSPPGPNIASTTVGEVVWLKLSQYAAQQKQQELDALEQEKKATVKSSHIRCRRCNGLHYTAKCPYKDTLLPMDEITGAAAAEGAAGDDDKSSAVAGAGAGGSSYVPPHLRAGANRGGAAGLGGASSSGRDDMPTIRIANLSEDTRKEDVEQLCRPFGSVFRVFLATDRNTGACRGYAFVAFYDHDSAERAISKLMGYGFDNLILTAEWANSAK